MLIVRRMLQLCVATIVKTALSADGSLALNRLSDDVGGVKHVLGSSQATDLQTMINGSCGTKGKPADVLSGHSPGEGIEILQEEFLLFVDSFIADEECPQNFCATHGQHLDFFQTFTALPVGVGAQFQQFAMSHDRSHLLDDVESGLFEIS